MRTNTPCRRFADMHFRTRTAETTKQKIAGLGLHFGSKCRAECQETTDSGRIGYPLQVYPRRSCPTICEFIVELHQSRSGRTQFERPAATKYFHMTFQNQIALLQQRFWSGDISAHETLQRLLKPYVALVVRRASQPSASNSPVARGIQRLLGRRNDERRHPTEFPTADEICQRLCDKLLQPPMVKNHQPDHLETIQFNSQTHHQ